jgi:uncharacterized damage-inducible protein DinB
MEQTSLDSLVATLEDGRRQLVSAVDGLTDEVAAVKPAPDRWSVLECLEHIAAVEHRFLGFAGTGATYDVPRIDPARERDLAERVVDRSTRREAPEAVVPTGRFQSVSTALTAFHEARDITVRFARDQADRLYTIKATHPRFGDLNGAELLHLMNGHALRHVAQIRETRRAVE